MGVTGGELASGSGAGGVEEATRWTAGTVAVGELGVDGFAGPAEAGLRRADGPLAPVPG
ncbi:hypothetical protein [Streptomyces sp. NPDC058086]|uniref:hypothetical protein n=1 Tax=Streptomyces sp. NPDC058086 TaxID=3346334 RepID=UPI0036EE2AC4